MKTMRIVVIGLMFAVLSLGNALAEDCFNAQGAAIASNFIQHNGDSSDYLTQTQLLISNVSGSTVTCKVTVYDGEGNDVSTEGTRIKAGSNPDTGWITVASSTSTFDIPAKGTRVFVINPGDRFMIGHAVIEWKSDEDPVARRALIASVRQITHRTVEGYHLCERVAVNGGQVF